MVEKLCDHCLEILSPMVTTNDVALMEFLSRGGAVTAQCSFPRESILTRMKDPLSLHQIRDSLTRLTGMGLVEKSPNAKPERFFLTPNGQTMLKKLTPGGNK